MIRRISNLVQYFACKSCKFEEFLSVILTQNLRKVKMHVAIGNDTIRRISNSVQYFACKSCKFAGFLCVKMHVAQLLVGRMLMVNCVHAYLSAFHFGSRNFGRMRLG